MPTFVTQLRVPTLTVGVLGVGFFLLNGAGNIAPFGREITAGIPATVLVFGLLGYSCQSAPKLEVCGESSYTLYLFHLLYFAIAGKLIEVGTGINVYYSTIA